MFTLLNHATCPPGKHRTLGDHRQEDCDITGLLICHTCRKPMLHCTEAVLRNNHPENHGYERQYVHVDPRDQEECTA